MLNRVLSVSALASRRTLVCLSHLRWGFVYQRPQHLMRRFAAERSVLFVEEPVHDAAIVRPRLDLREADGVRIAVPVLPSHLTGSSAVAAQRVLIDEWQKATLAEALFLGELARRWKGETT